MAILKFIIAFSCIIGVFAPFIKIIFSKQTEREKHVELATIMILFFAVLPALGYVAHLLFGNDYAIGTVVIIGLIGINFLVFKDKL
jgi:hypothetical protein